MSREVISPLSPWNGTPLRSRKRTEIPSGSTLQPVASCGTRAPTSASKPMRFSNMGRTWKVLRGPRSLPGLLDSVPGAGLATTNRWINASPVGAGSFVSIIASGCAGASGMMGADADELGACGSSAAAGACGTTGAAAGASVVVVVVELLVLSLPPQATKPRTSANAAARSQACRKRAPNEIIATLLVQL